MAGGDIRPSLERPTILIHNNIYMTESFPLLMAKAACLNWMFCSLLTHKLSIASRSAREEAISLPHSPLGVQYLYIVTHISYPQYCLLVFMMCICITYMHLAYIVFRRICVFIPLSLTFPHQNFHLMFASVNGLRSHQKWFQMFPISNFPGGAYPQTPLI